MSVEAVNQFLVRVSEDEKLQQDLANILEAEGNDREAVTELGATYGYQFTPEELWAEIQNRQSEFLPSQQAGELSDEELEAVAGGWKKPPIRSNSNFPYLARGLMGQVSTNANINISTAKW
jgi:predicted ribosomally synthesized peptide with nif11-like leader